MIAMEVAKPISDDRLTRKDVDNEIPSAKRPKLSSDRLSELPDLPLVHILSHLYVEEAARTTVLSKRFNSLWNLIPTLNFSDENSGKDGEFFVSFVDNALQFHRLSEIGKFSIKFRYNFLYKCCVDEWIRFAIQKKVKSLYLNLNQKLIPDHNRFQILEHKLPECIYNNENLVELVTCCCKFVVNGGINWNTLKLLSITRTKTNENLISRVLDGCPLLHTLELIEWSGFDKLKIKSVSLRVLRVVEELCPNYMPQLGYCSLEVSGPNLEFLEVSGPLYRSKLRVCDVGSLVNATMNFDVKPERHGSKASWFVVRDQDIVREVLENLFLVKTLTLGGWCIKALSTCEAYNLSSPWSERKSLTLCMPVIKWDHLGIASLFHSSPCLETLVIKLSYCSDMCALEHVASHNHEDYYWKTWSTIYKCTLQHLKTVKVVGFRESCRSMKPLFQLLEFLLRHSKLLEDIVIQTSRYVTRGTLDEALKLVAVPTASPDAVIQFEPPHLWVDPLVMYHN